ncbi:PTS sugar transporter subunit IIA [Desulfovibrio sp. OttesenSCG-928-A18]|nr:PTS sugar transporter subunit IIA [Desulfovibrio sp. OttesenSCG-928-A18]
MPSDTAGKQQVGIILVTHVDYGSSLLRAAEFIVGSTLLDCTCIQVDSSLAVEETVTRLQEAVDRLSTGSGVLVLTDMFGGTPTNLSLSLLGSRKDVEVLTGMNLPMLLRVLANRELPLNELADLAAVAGREGIIAAGQLLRSKNETRKENKEGSDT